jgi:hypothetical protein
MDLSFSTGKKIHGWNDAGAGVGMGWEGGATERFKRVFTDVCACVTKMCGSNQH